MNMKNILVCFLMLVLIAPVFASTAKADQCERNKEKLMLYHELADYYCESLYQNAKLCSKYTKLVEMYEERVTSYCDISCKDTDNRDYYTKGFMQAGIYDSGQWDVCYDDYLLVEYYCENNEGRKEAIQCANGCQDGACLQGECDSHQLSIGEIFNDDGKIAVSYKIVGEDNVNAELMIVTSYVPSIPEETIPEPVEEPIDPSPIDPPTGGGGGGGGAGGISCPITGGVCGAGSGSDVIYCTIYTQCGYPEYKPNTRYYLKLIDETCPGVYDTAEITPLPTCTDSDGGVNYYEKGEVTILKPTGYTYKYTEYCVNSNQLTEQYCKEDNSLGYVPFYNCTNGCQDGACIEEPGILIEEDIGLLKYIGTITDDDCGFIQDYDCNLYVAQYQYPPGGVDLVNAAVEDHNTYFSNSNFIEGINDLATEEGFEVEEASSGEDNVYVLGRHDGELSDYIVVWYKDNKLVGVLIHNWNTVLVDDEIFELLLEAYLAKYPSDLTFEQPGPTCTDSDGGQNWYTKGQTYGLEAPDIWDTFTDYCGTAGQEAGKLVEYVCQPNNYVQKILYSCTSGCQDGKCIA